MKIFILRLLYRLLLYCILPFILFYLYFFRGKKQPAYRQHIGERFGFFTSKKSDLTFIWIHAVSVGETRAVQKLVELIQKNFPNYGVLMTHSTPTGRETGQTLYRPLFAATPERFQQVYLPYDYPTCVHRFFQHFNIHCGLLVETEIWFNLIAAAKNAQIPLFLINARLSDKSGQKYHHSIFYSLTQTALQTLHGVYTQSEGDSQRFWQYLEFQPHAMLGNLKFDLTPPIEQINLGKKWFELWHKNAKNIIIFASTREGEEALILQQIVLNLAHFTETLFILVPRHPQRFDEVETLIIAAGLPYERRTQLSDKEATIRNETKILLGDSLGELFAYYEAADITFVGGSLLPYGCQNIIEPAILGKPILFGSSTFNFTEATQLALSAQAAIQVENEKALFEALHTLIQAPQTCSKMGQTAQAFARTHQGATTKTLTALINAGVHFD